MVGAGSMSESADLPRGDNSRWMDGKFLQDNQGIVGAVVGFLVSQAVQAWRDHEQERRAIAAEIRADKRAQRDAKLARLRKAFEPVLVSGSHTPQPARPVTLPR